MVAMQEQLSMGDLGYGRVREPEPGETCPTCHRMVPTRIATVEVGDALEGKAHRNAPETSHRTARAIAPRTGTQRYRVLAALVGMGPLGATDEELVTLTHLSANTVRPRRVELVEGAYVTDSGTRRSTDAGHRAVVWVATPAGRAAVI